MLRDTLRILAFSIFARPAKTKSEALQRKHADRIMQGDAMVGFMFELSERDEALILLMTNSAMPP